MRKLSYSSSQSKKWSYWLRNCSICHLSLSPINWLCTRCWKKIKSLYLLPQDMIRKQEEFTHIRLFDWNKENDFFIRLFLNSLKKGGPSFIFNQIVWDFLHRIVQVLPFPKKAVLIPAPTRSQVHLRDHAFCLASSFSYFSGAPIKNPLIWLSPLGKEQKQKVKWERKKRFFYVKENFIRNKEVIIFIDDILTTGATAQAAWKALGEPEQFLALTLAWRSEFNK